MWLLTQRDMKHKSIFIQRGKQNCITESRVPVQPPQNQLILWILCQASQYDMVDSVFLQISTFLQFVSVSWPQYCVFYLTDINYTRINLLNLKKCFILHIILYIYLTDTSGYFRNKWSQYVNDIIEDLLKKKALDNNSEEYDWVKIERPMNSRSGDGGM